MWTQRLMWIAWPAFLVAGVIEMLVFAMVDPQDLHWFGQPVTLSRTGVYTLAFFGFWALPMVSSALTTLLAMSPFELNRCPVPDEERPDDCPQAPLLYMNKKCRAVERGLVGCVSKVLGSCLAPLSKIFQWQACWLFTMRRKASVSRIRTCLCRTSTVPSSTNLENVRLTVSSLRPR